MFSWPRLRDADPVLRCEMASTGEVWKLCSSNQMLFFLNLYSVQWAMSLLTAVSLLSKRKSNELHILLSLSLQNDWACPLYPPFLFSCFLSCHFISLFSSLLSLLLLLMLLLIMMMMMVMKNPVSMCRLPASDQISTQPFWRRCSPQGSSCPREESS